MVGLRDDGEAIAAQPLDEPELPERLVAVEPLREDAAGERLERLLVSGLGQRGVADVVVGVEVRVVHPHGPSLAEGNEREPLAIARDEMQPALHVLGEFAQRGRWAGEDHDGRNVHMRRPVGLEVQERRVEG